jgi:hypothetical protein
MPNPTEHATQDSWNTMTEGETGQSTRTSDVNSEICDNAHLQALAGCIGFPHFLGRVASADNEANEANKGQLTDPDSDPEEPFKPFGGVQQANQKHEDGQLGQPKEQYARAKGKEREKDDVLPVDFAQDQHVSSVAITHGNCRQDGRDTSSKLCR